MDLHSQGKSQIGQQANSPKVPKPINTINKRDEGITSKQDQQSIQKGLSFEEQLRQMELKERKFMGNSKEEKEQQNFLLGEDFSWISGDQLQTRNGKCTTHNQLGHEGRPLVLDEERYTQSVVKSVPINQWRIKFSGEGGTSLNDFIRKVELYARAERISKPQLILSIHHLLTGKAEVWYMANYEDFETWDELVEGLRKEFLSLDYKNFLHEEIMQRKQGKYETFAAFINDMKALFKMVNPPYMDDLKIFIVKKNMRSEYLRSLPGANVRTFEQLVEVCRQVDEINLFRDRQNANTNINHGSLMEPSYFPRQLQKEVVFRGGGREFQRVNEVSVATRNTRQGTQYVGRERNSNEVRMRCWNCREKGHGFIACNQPKLRVFCYKCGMTGETTDSCPKRHKLGSGRHSIPAGNNEPYGANRQAIPKPTAPMESRNHHNSGYNPDYAASNGHSLIDLTGNSNREAPATTGRALP